MPARGDRTAPDISVVLPCYRGAELALASVARLAEFLGGTGRPWEIVVVDDGGGDFGDGPWTDAGPIRLLRFPVNRGKGAAVAAGMRAATGLARIFTDVDLPYDLELIPIIAEYVLDRGFHMVVGDRTLPGSRYTKDIGWRRHLASAVFSQVAGKLVTGGFFDTQCGLKGLRGDVADLVFSLTRIQRFTFDVELIYLALVFRLDIKRIPVRLRHNDTSSVRLGRDSATALLDLLRIKRHQLAGHYRSPALEAVVAGDFAATRARVLGRMAARMPLAGVGA